MPLNRVVDRLVVHPAPLAPSELLDRLVSERTRYLVLDMDRTTHLAHNLGELLGWEVIAETGYGPHTVEALEAQRGKGRFLFSPRHPLAGLRYLTHGARLWAYPGLMYLVFGKLGLRSARGRQWVFSRFGPEPVPKVQRLPMLALLHHLSAVPMARLREMAQRIWSRLAGDQVFTREDLDDLRERFPSLTIILSSASPQPMVEVAAGNLGVDHAVYTTIETADGRMSAPARRDRRFMLPARPTRVAPPDSFFHNAGTAKVAHLLERFEDMADPEVETVGVSDTGYGEDYAFRQHFTKVADINTRDHFPPIVCAQSPLQEIHSARVLTCDERARRAAGGSGYLDPKRKPEVAAAGAIGRETLVDLLRPDLDATNALGLLRQDLVQSLAAAKAELTEQMSGLREATARAVADYNAGAPTSARALNRQLQREVRREEAVARRLARLERPLAALELKQREHLEHATRVARRHLSSPKPAVPAPSHHAARA